MVLVLAIAFGVLYFIKDKKPDNPGTPKTILTMVLGSGAKTEYNVGDTFEPAAVSLLFDDKQLVEITDSSKLTFSDYDMSKSGVYTVKVRYDSGDEYATASYLITVYNSVLESIRAEYKDESLLWGEKIDKNKLLVTANYSNSRSEQITDYELKYNSSPDTYGLIEVKVSYQGFVTTFNVQIVEKEIEPKYQELQDEVCRILTVLDVANPTCPKDYNFIYDANNVGSITTNGVLRGYSQDDTLALVSFLSNSVFDGYTLQSGPEETNEAIFPSVKFVFYKQTKKLRRPYLLLLL